jgi:hypothetical protein
MGEHDVGYELGLGGNERPAVVQLVVPDAEQAVLDGCAGQDDLAERVPPRASACG